MNLNRLFSMLIRMFLRSAVQKGVDYVARKGKPEGAMTPEERKQAQSAKEMAKKAQKASRVMRRFTR